MKDIMVRGGCSVRGGYVVVLEEGVVCSGGSRGGDTVGWGKG